MRRRSTRGVLLVLLCVGLTVGGAVSAVGAHAVDANAAVQSEDPVEVTLEDVTAESGDTVTVTMATSNVDDLAGYEATVSFDPSVVQVESVSGVDMDDPITNVDNENGTVSMTQSAPEPIDANPNPVLAELTLSVVGGQDDYTDLGFEDVSVNNDQENLPVTGIDGSVTVADPVEVSLEDVEGGTGETVEVTMATDNVDDLAGYEAVVTYDPSVVQIQGVEGVDLDDPMVNVDNDEGWLSMTQSAPEAVDGNPNPVLANLIVEVVGEHGDETTLAFDEDELTVNNVDENLATVGDDGSVAVVDPPLFNVTGAQAPTDPTREGESVAVSAAVENTGGSAGTQTIELAVDGETVDSSDVSLEVGESATVDLSWDTPAGTSGDHAVTVRSADDSATATAPVCEAGDADYSGTVDSFDTTQTQRHITLLPTEEFYPDCVDMNGDGDVGSLDVTQIMQKLIQ